MPTDTDKKLNGTPEPFRRPVVWGRPPATVFRAGPLPKGTGLSAGPEQPRAQAGPGILTGSMIPRAAPNPTPAPAPPPPVPAPAQAQAPDEPRVAPASRPRETPVVAPAPAAAPVDQAADLTVRPLPAMKSEPVAPAVAPHLDPLQAFQPTVHDEIEPTVGPRQHGPTSARTTANRLPLYVGIAVAAVAVLALGTWIWTRPPATAPAPAPAAAVAPAGTLPSVAVPAIIPAETPSAPVDGEAAVTPGPAMLVPATPAPALRPVVPPPVAVRPQTDPDAPVVTRPQPIG